MAARDLPEDALKPAETPPRSPRSESKAGPSGQLIFALMAMMFLAAMEVTIVSTAMPKVVGTIGGMELYPWVFTGFMLASTIVGPFYGKFADLFGVRRLMFTAIGLFVLGSALCGLASTMLQLVLFRAVQGLGAGGLMVLIMTAFGQLYPPELRGKSMGFISVVWGVAGLVGPFIGGLIVSRFAWPWIFWINVPAGVLAALLIARSYPRQAQPARSHAFDWLGGLLLTGGVLGVMLAASLPGGTFAWGWLLGPLALVGFIWQEGRAPEPLLPLAPFRRRAFWVPVAILFFATLSLVTVMTYVPLLIQSGLGRSPAESGAALMPMMLLWPLSSALAGGLVNRFGFKRLMILAAILVCSGYALLALPLLKDSTWVIAAEAGLVGLGMGILSSISTIAMQAAVPRHQLGIASSTSGLMRSLGQTLGLSIIGGLQLKLFASQLQTSGLSGESLTLASNTRRVLEMAASGTLPEIVWKAFSTSVLASITTVFAVAFFLSLAVFTLSLWMSPLAPKELAMAEGHAQ